MKRIAFIVRAALVGALAVACSDTEAISDATDTADKGGVNGFTSDSGGAGGETAIAGGKAGGSAVESSAGETGQGGAGTSCWELRAWTPEGCGTCDVTMEEYCAVYNCRPDTLPTCDGLPEAYSIDEGCGLLRLRMSGHGGAIYTESVYEVETRQLAYHYDNGSRSSGCVPVIAVGEEPICGDWVTLCEGLGGA